MLHEALLALFGLFVIIAGFWFEARGRKAERLDDMERTLEDVRRALAARDRLRHDPDAARKLRDRFTR